MANGGGNQNSILRRILKFLSDNKTISIIGLAVTTLGVCVNALMLKEVRCYIGWEPEIVCEDKITPEPDTSRSVIRNEYIVYENQPQFVEGAETSLSIVFQNFYGENFVSLNISPKGKESIVRSVLNGYTEEFRSSTGLYYLQILSIDYNDKKVVVQVSRKS